MQAAELTLKRSFCMNRLFTHLSGFYRSFALHQLLSPAASRRRSGPTKCRLRVPQSAETSFSTVPLYIQILHPSFLLHFRLEDFQSRTETPTYGKARQAKIEDKRKLAHSAKSSGTQDKSLFYVQLPSLSSR